MPQRHPRAGVKERVGRTWGGERQVRGQRRGAGMAARRNASVVHDDARAEPLTIKVEHGGLPLLLTVRPPPSPSAMCSMRSRRPEM
jgi:hypothetical protein